MVADILLGDGVGGGGEQMRRVNVTMRQVGG